MTNFHDRLILMINCRYNLVVVDPEPPAALLIQSLRRHLLRWPRCRIEHSALWPVGWDNLLEGGWDGRLGQGKGLIHHEVVGCCELGLDGKDSLLIHRPCW